MIRNLVLLLEKIVFVYGFATIYGKRLKCEIYDVLYIIADLILLTGINEKSIPVYFATLSYVLMCVYCMLKYDASLKKAMVNLMLVVAIIAATQGFCYMMVWILNVRSMNVVGERELIASALQLLFLIVSMPKMRLEKLSDFLLKKNWLLNMIGIFFLIVLGSEIWKIKMRGFLEASDYVPVIYFVSLVFVIAYEWQKTKTEAEMEKAQMEMNMLYYEAYEGLIQSIREKQHDFKNHITTISGMLYANMNSEKIIANQKVYFEEMLGDFKETSLLTMIENPSLSGFIIHKCNEAEKMGITVEQHCAFTSQMLKVPEYKLVEMMGILYDNAIEAMPKDIDGKKIWLELWKEDNLFWFSIRNCYEGEMFCDDILGAGYSSKGLGRGIGLKKLRKLLDENGGEICLEHGKEGSYKTIKFIIHIPI